MKISIGLLMLWTLAAGSIARYAEPAVPKGITVVAPTEDSVKKEFQREQKERQYAQAAKLAGQVYERLGCRKTYAEGTGRVAVDFAISPRVLAGLVFVESSCNTNAVSGRNSVGLMQVNPKVWKYTRAELSDPKQNIEIGAKILATYIHRWGLVEGLHHYNGLGNPTDEYATKVLTAAGLIR
jgi:soluble lytic murein transglycosylase-like protein